VTHHGAGAEISSVDGVRGGLRPRGSKSCGGIGGVAPQCPCLPVMLPVMHQGVGTRLALLCRS
jgi:hypothetical protein